LKKTNEILLQIIKENNLKQFIHVLENNNYDLKENNHHVFISCCEFNRFDFIKYILTLDYDINFYKGMAFSIACNNNSLEVVKVLLMDDRISPASDSNAPLSIASESGFYELFKLLLKDKRTNPADDNCWTLLSVCEVYTALEDDDALENEKTTIFLKIISELFLNRSIRNNIDQKWIDQYIYSDVIKDLYTQSLITNKIYNF
jgi:ankyrin repeat protein